MKNKAGERACRPCVLGVEKIVKQADKSNTGRQATTPKGAFGYFEKIEDCVCNYQIIKEVVSANAAENRPMALPEKLEGGLRILDGLKLLPNVSSRTERYNS